MCVCVAYGVWCMVCGVRCMCDVCMCAHTQDATNDRSCRQEAQALEHADRKESIQQADWEGSEGDGQEEQPRVRARHLHLFGPRVFRVLLRVLVGV
jgi:hypothetical protein